MVSWQIQQNILLGFSTINFLLFIAKCVFLSIFEEEIINLSPYKMYLLTS
jgi:hypothetical protein